MRLAGGLIQPGFETGKPAIPPNGGLSPSKTGYSGATTQRTILNLLLRLQRERNLSLIVIPHDMDVVRCMCDRVAVLLEGRVVEVAQTRDFFAAPTHPHSQALLKPRFRAARTACGAYWTWRSPRCTTAGRSPAPMPDRS